MTSARTENGSGAAMRVVVFVGSILTVTIALLAYISTAYASCDRVDAQDKRMDNYQIEMRELRKELSADQRETRIQIREQFDSLRKELKGGRP